MGRGRFMFRLRDGCQGVGTRRSYPTTTPSRMLRASRRKIKEWFCELEHYGFIVLEQLGSLGVEGKGKSPIWRLTELGVTSKHAGPGVLELARKDFLKWDGTDFDRKTFRNPVPTTEPRRFLRGNHCQFQRGKQAGPKAVPTRET